MIEHTGTLPLYAGFSPLAVVFPMPDFVLPKAQGRHRIRAGGAPASMFLIPVTSAAERLPVRRRAEN